MLDDFDGDSGLPLTNRDQSCALCEAEQVAWVHPLDREKIELWSATDIDEVLRKPLAVFRAADLGRVELHNGDE
jgi:hypothetical protein